MRPYDLEKLTPPVEPPVGRQNKEVRTFPDWAGLQHQMPRPHSNLYARAANRFLSAHFRLWLVGGLLVMAFLVWWLLPENVNSPATGQPPSASLGILYVSSKVQLPNSSVEAGLEGLVITEVKAGSPASRAGLQPGDLIIQVGTHTVLAEDSLLTLLSDYKPGDSVALEVVRNGSQLQFTVTFN